MYKIGEFSKLVDIPVRTLRYYAEYGVLVPHNVDMYTGYKYYSDENIIECELIKLLKSLDFTLDEIVKYKDSLTEDVIINKQKEIEEKITLFKLKYERLTVMLDEFKNNDKIMSLKNINNHKVLRRKVWKKNY